MNEKYINILLAEDDPDDQYLISEALDESHLEANLFIVENGEDLLKYLNHQGIYQDRAKWPSPNVILLDLNMPRIDGREALKIIKNDPELKLIPILVLTTSRTEEDIRKTYAEGASGFITKPASFQGLVDVMRSIGTFWLKSVELPPTDLD